MRTLLLITVLAACGDSNSDAAPDAALPDPPACRSPVAAPCTTQVANPALPTLFLTEGFVLAPDPTDHTKAVWMSQISTSVVTTSFTVPYRDGDRITGLTMNVYGSGPTAESRESGLHTNAIQKQQYRS